MSTEQNKSLVRRMVDEIFNQGNISAADEYLAPDFVEREELPPGISRDREGVKQISAAFRGAFPDFRATIDDLVAEDDKVVLRMTWTGTQDGEFMGIPPTGRSVSFGVIDVLRIADGKVAEHWGQMDNMGLMEQLGVGSGTGGA